MTDLIDRLESLSGELTYKPGVDAGLWWWQGWSPDEIKVGATMKVVNVHDPHGDTGQQNRWSCFSVKDLLSMDDTEFRTVVGAAYVKALKEIEDHEVEEWAMICGTQIIDPHPDGILPGGC